MNKSFLLFPVGAFVVFSIVRCDALHVSSSGLIACYGEVYREGAYWFDVSIRKFPFLLGHDELYRGLAMTYGIFVLVAPFLPVYRATVRELVADGIWLEIICILGTLYWLSMWAWGTATGRGVPAGATPGLTFLLGLPALLATLVLAPTSIVWLPVVLFYLPGLVLLLVAFLLTRAFMIVFSPVKALLLVSHYLHYLFVPHPAEAVYKAGMAKHIPYPELAENVADAMYQYDLKDYERLPKAWRSKNWQRRIDAFHDRLKAEDRFMQELIRNLRLKDQLRE